MSSVPLTRAPTRLAAAALGLSERVFRATVLSAVRAEDGRGVDVNKLEAFAGRYIPPEQWHRAERKLAGRRQYERERKRTAV